MNISQIINLQLSTLRTPQWLLPQWEILKTIFKPDWSDFITLRENLTQRSFPRLSKTKSSSKTRETSSASLHPNATDSTEMKQSSIRRWIKLYSLLILWKIYFCHQKYLCKINSFSWMWPPLWTRHMLNPEHFIREYNVPSIGSSHVTKQSSTNCNLSHDHARFHRWSQLW